MAAHNLVFLVLLGALVMFVWGRWRYDLVALAALLVLVLAGIVPAEAAFLGFGHAAVITVAAVLVISRGLYNSGVVDLLVKLLAHVGDRTTMQVLALTAVAAVCSAFMNNVGALALLMPVAIQMARRRQQSPSFLLMPLAFGSLLGGLTTLIGTPPNIIIGMLRKDVAGAPFRMFDFAPVGVPLALLGVLFLAFLGWRLLPQRKGRASREEMFQIKAYLTEARLREDSPLLHKSFADLEEKSQGEVKIVGLVRDQQRHPAPSPLETLRQGDILVLEGDSKSLHALMDDAGLELVGDKPIGEEELQSDKVTLVEAVVASDSAMEGRTASGMNLRWRHGMNLLAVARQGERVRRRMDHVRFRAGDVLLLQGPEQAVAEKLQELGLLPLAERGLRLGHPRRLLLSAAIFAVAIVLGAMGWLPIQVAFVMAAMAMVALDLVPLRDAYRAVDWPVIVLLAALIPVGAALESTGGSQMVADALLKFGDQLPPLVSLGVLMVATMFLSDVVNNAAAAILMASVGVGMAEALALSPDPFLMAVAVGASSAFLTPIGHQSNTLVFGPGGYKFGDYWRMGLPLEVLLVALSLLLIPRVWPF